MLKSKSKLDEYGNSQYIVHSNEIRCETHFITSEAAAWMKVEDAVGNCNKYLIKPELLRIIKR